jgi:hypothetical protein
MIESRSEPFSLDIYSNFRNPSVKDSISTTGFSLYTVHF